MKITKENAVAQVQSSVSSIFSKEDVLFLINSIEVGSSRKITPFDIGRAIDKTISWVEDNERELLDLDSAEIELNYDNKIEVVGVPFNWEELRDALENNFMDFAEEEEEEVTETEQEVLDNEL